MVQAKVLDVDVEKERISLGVKQLAGDPFESASQGVKRGQVVTCSVTEVNDGGVEVTFGEDGAIGFIKKAELARDRADQRPERFNVGDKVDARVTQVDRGARRILLSIKAREVEEEKQAMADYGSADSGASLGDILGEALRKKQGSDD
jgi:small subunit ribosomal protein S1